MRRLFLPITFLVSSAFATAQYIEPVDGLEYEAPKQSRKSAVRVAPPSATLTLPGPPRTELAAPTQRDRLRVKAPAGTEVVGVHRSVQLDPGAINNGWASLSAGGRIWRWQVVSSGAAALRLRFTNFDLGNGQLWVHTGDPNGELLGPYTGKGPDENGTFWTGTLFAESAVIEFQPGPRAFNDQTLPFELVQVSHIWRSIDSLNPLGAKNAGAPQPGQAEPCHLDVTCFSQWSDTARSVARILFEEGGGTLTCSGTLMNDRGGTRTPYYLTAAHCVSDNFTARTVEAFWFFQTSTCNGQPPNPGSVPRRRGARLLATAGGGRAGDDKGDFSLLQLDSIPDGVFFAGWDPNPLQLGTSVTGIHHPSGDFKRISLGRVVPDNPFNANTNVFVMVQKSQGLAEPGSSGSGLFMDNGRLVGTLSFGPKVPDFVSLCSIDPLYVGYGRLSGFFEDVRPFLDPNGGPPPPPPAQTDTLIDGEPQNLTLGPVGEPALVAVQRTFEVPAGVTRATVTLTTATGNADVDLFVNPGSAPAVVGGNVQAAFRSEGADGNETIVIDGNSNPPLAPGTYHVGFAVFTANVQISSTIRVDFERPNVAPPTGIELTAGRPEEFTLPRVDAPTLFSGTSAYRLVVPDGSTKLEVRLVTAGDNADVDLYVRRGSAPGVQDGFVVADFEATSFSGNELITIGDGTGTIPAGTYFIATALFTEGVQASCTLTAELSAGAGPPAVDTGRTITLGQPSGFQIGPVDGPTFFGNQVFQFDVPADAIRMTVDVDTQTAGADVDLHVRLGQPPEVLDGAVVSHFSSESLTGTEQVVITRDSSPPLAAGRVYIGLALFSTGVAANGTITVAIETEGGLTSAPRINAATHAASFGQVAIAPGQIVTIFGVNLGPGAGVSPPLDANGNLQTFTDGTVILFDGAPASHFFLRGDQANIQAPYSIAGRTTTRIVVVRNGEVSNSLDVPVAASSPEIFAFSDGSERAVVLNSDGSVNSPSNPARRGDFVTFFGTGEGATNPASVAGRLAPTVEPFPRPLLPVEVQFGGRTGQLIFAGSAPGFAGLLQVNVFIPASAPTGGAVAIQLIVGPNANRRVVTISIQ